MANTGAALNSQPREQDMIKLNIFMFHDYTEYTPGVSLSKSKYFDGIVPSIFDYMNH